MRPECIKCGGYLLPCRATANGIHPKVIERNSGRVIFEHKPREV